MKTLVFLVMVFFSGLALAEPQRVSFQPEMADIQAQALLREVYGPLINRVANDPAPEELQPLKYAVLEANKQINLRRIKLSAIAAFHPLGKEIISQLHVDDLGQKNLFLFIPAIMDLGRTVPKETLGYILAVAMVHELDHANYRDAHPEQNDDLMEEAEVSSWTVNLVRPLTGQFAQYQELVDKFAQAKNEWQNTLWIEYIAKREGLALRKNQKKN